MPKRAVTRLSTFSAMIRLLLPAWLLFLVAGLVQHPLSLVLLLTANALVMTAVCRAIGLDRECTYTRSAAQRGLAYFLMATTYTAFVALVIAAPVWWLARDSSLVAALGLSAALVVALYALWRIWPAFALPFLWDDAYPDDAATGSWLLTALRRSVAFARHLTREHDLFFSSGLPAGFGMLFLAVGALALSGFGGLLAGEIRTAALFVYALLLSPVAHLLLVNRCFRALIADARGSRRRHGVDPAAVAIDTPDESPHLGTDIDRDELDATLICAVRSAQMGLALAALERGANPDALPSADSRDQRSVLMVAVTLPDLRLLRALIAKGVDVNRIHGGITPLVAATRDSYEGRPDAVTMLLANGADARIADADASTALHHAARCAEPIIAALLIDAGADVNAVNAEGLTALGIACGCANWPIAAFLLSRRAKVDVESAQPALIHAAGIPNDDTAGVKLLLKHRAIVDARNALERTALMTAALAGHVRIVDTLLASGANVDLVDSRGTGALMEAARSGSVGAIHALGKHKPSVDALDSHGRTALMVACQSRHADDDSVRALLALGADRAVSGTDGKRAVDHAAAAGRWHLVALIDPAYALPSNIDPATSPRSDNHADHLLDALRFGHWNVAAEFVGAVRTWPPSALADLYLELADEEHAQARVWLLNHGMDAAAPTTGHGDLADALLSRLPASLAALDDIVERGAAVGGAALIVRVLAAAGESTDGDPIRKLAFRLLARGGDWCGRSASGSSALHLAVAGDDDALAARLLELGADPNARDAQGRTPLHIALASSSARADAFLPMLVSAGANPEITTAAGETPLGMALARTDGDGARFLDWASWRLPLRRLRPSDLPAAATAGDLVAVERLLQLGLPLDGTDEQGATALVRASGSGHTALVVRLLDLGADTQRVTRSGIHALAAAVSAGREAVVRTLLARGVPAGMELGAGGTPLILAAAIGEVRIADALVEAGADVNAQDPSGSAPMHAAAQYAFATRDTGNVVELFELLLRSGARADVRNAAGQDALLLALGASAQAGAQCDAEHLRLVCAFLLENGAVVDVQDSRGVSAMHACAMHGLFGCTRLLKAHGASPDLLDGFGRSAADVASILGYVDVAAELGSERARAFPSVRQTLRRPAGGPD